MIIYSREFHQSIEELIRVLYVKEYFGFELVCQLYAEKIYDFVDYNIYKPIGRDTPKSLQKFGKKCIKYKANHRTSWFIFYDQKGDQFLINHILNNHSHEFPELM
ncbi:hypothetical protein [Chryseobacterium sp. Leaf394]|uniref:hypothetical protein n=1 Tax=Chryseobacterium sp. Leaf394 TaxID=1736361 RepID=UPI0006F40693|nr:hypothetical protein [Chryseobacterium sp. Leaf394]KQS92805.1 hypothetical protein ASG21_10315 [Chryseobacterium sp. Leaf394]